MVFETTAPPAATALPCKNARRERVRFIPIPPVELTATCSCRLLFQRLDRHFLEEHNVIVAMILQSEPAEGRPPPTLRLEIELLVPHRIALFVVRHFLAVYGDNRAVPIQRDLHGVPLRTRLPCVFHERLRQRIQHPRL